MLSFLMKIPLVRDFVAIYVAIFRSEYKPATMGRLSFWKAVAGFLIVYVVVATFFNIFWMQVLLPHVKHHGSWFVDIDFFVECAVFLFGWFLLLIAGVWRLRDAGRSGWWSLLWLLPYLGPLILLVLYLLPSKFSGGGDDLFREISAPPY